MKKFRTIINVLERLLAKNFFLKKNKVLLISVSAGQDSTLLVFLLFLLQKKWKIQIFLLYCNHFWEKESFYTFLHLSKIAWTFELKLAFLIPLIKPVSEKTARIWRLKNSRKFFYFSQSLSFLTGHTETDHIETFLINFFRGSGFFGTSALQGKKVFIYQQQHDFLLSQHHLFEIEKLKNKQTKNSFRHAKKKKISFFKTKKNKIKSPSIQKKIFCFTEIKKKMVFFRPFFKKSRFEIQQICLCWKLPIFPDKTNSISNYTRNRIRNQLLPSLRFFFNPKLDQIISRYTKLIIGDTFYFDHLVQTLLLKICFESKNFYSLNLNELESLPLPIQRRICFIFFTKKIKLETSFERIHFFLNDLKKISQNDSLKESYHESCQWFFIPKLGVVFYFNQIVTILK